MIGNPDPRGSIDHIAIAVRSAEASLAYYTDTLGMPLIGDEINEAAGVRLVYVDAGNVLLQLVEPLRDGPIREWLESNGEGLHHLCLAVDNIPDALRSLGADPASARITLGGRGRRCCFVADAPNGLRVELTEREPASDAGDRAR